MSDVQPVDLDDLQRVAVKVRELTDDNWLADMVELAHDEIARLREERRWVPVGERLPTVQGDDVLTARGPWGDGGYSIARGWWNGECWMFYGSDRDSPPVAFWMPLPPGPEGEA